MRNITFKRLFDRGFTRNINTLLLLILVAMFGLIMFGPIDVLKNWKISVPDKVYINTQFNVTSTSEKVLAVSGYSSRAVECVNRSDNWVSYSLSGAPADKQPGENPRVDYPIVIPDTVPDLPTKCRYTTNVCYNINALRRFCEFNRSNDFTLYKTKPRESTKKKSEEKKVSNTPATSNNIAQTPNNSSTSTTNRGTTREVIREVEKEPTQEPKRYHEVCDPLLNILGIKVGETNCRQERL